MNTHDIELLSAVMGAITDVWDRAKQIDDAADEVLDLIEAYCKRRGEPVAWRVHPFDYGVGYEGAYALTSRPDQVVAWERKGWEVQPLFTAPQPAEPVKGPSDDLAHEIWAAAQTAPGEGIEDAVERIAALLARRIEEERE